MKRTATACLGLALILLVPCAAQAVDGYWTGSSNTIWQNNANWTGSGYPGSYNGGRWEFSTFNSAGNGNTTIDVGTGLILDAVYFDTTNAAAYTVGSGAVGSQTFTFYGSYDWIVMSDSVTNNQVFNANIVTPRNVRQNSTSKTLTFAGAMWNGAGSGANTLSLYGSGDILISGVISNNNGSGTATMALAKYGSGTLTLSNNNTYNNTTTVSGGTLTLSRQTGSLSSSTPLTFGGPGTFNMDNTGASGALSQSLGALTFNAGEGTVRTTRSVDYDEAITFSSLVARTAGAGGNFVNGGGVNGGSNGFNLTGVAAGFIDKGIFYGGADYASMNGAGTYVRALNYATTGGDPNTVDIDTITAGRHVKLTASPANQNSVTLLSLNLSGGGVNWPQNASQTLTVPGIIKSGGGAASTISGGTAVTGGSGIELVIRTDTSSDQLNVNTPINGTGALTKTGAGTLTLNVTNTYTGATTVNAGTLAYGTNDAISAGAITINGGTVAMGSCSDAVGAVTLTAGSITGSGTLTGTSYTMNNPGNASVSIVLAGTCGLTMNGRGTLTLTGTNTYTGATQVNSGGTLIVSSIKNGGVPSNIGASSSAAANLSLETGNATMSTLRYIGPGDTTDRLISIASYAAAALDSSGSGALKFINPGAMGRSGPNYGSLLVLTGSNTNDNTLAMSFGQYGTGTGVAKTGPGRWILSGANTHSGTGETWPHFNAILNCATAILGGTLGVTWLADYSTASPIGAGTDATDLIINGGTLQYIGAGSTSGTMNRLFSLGVGPSAGTLDASGEAGSPLVLTGIGAITILGTGTRTLTLTGSNTDANTLAAVIGGTGANATSLIKSGAGTWGLGGANTYTGPTTIRGGILSVNSIKNVGGAANALGQPALANATISIGSGTTSGQLTYTGIGDTSDRVINMAGTSGGVTLSQSGSGLIKFTSALTATGAGAKTLTLQGSTIGTGEFAGAIVDGSGTTTLAKSGSGTWTLSGVNTYTGGTVVNAGKLVVAAAGSLPTNDTVTVNAGGNLSLQDNTVRTNTVGGLTVAGGATLTFDWVGSATDKLTTTNSVTTGGNIGIWLNPVSPGGSNLVLIHADGGGLTNAAYFLANPAVSATLTVTDTDVMIGGYGVISPLATAYWYGGQVAGASNAMALTDGTVGNWSTTQSSYTPTNALPGTNANVFFSAVGATQQSNIVMGAGMTLNSLTFDDPATVTINDDGNQLSLNGTNAITANESANIFPGIVPGTNQTWTVADSKTLTVGGRVGGAISLTKSGAGTLTLSGGTTNAYSGLTTVSAGTLLLGKTNAANAIANGGLTISSGATVQYTGESTDMMGPGVVTINGTGRLDFNGKTDIIGNIAIVCTGATVDTTAITNTAGGGSLSVGTVVISPADGYVSQIDAGTGRLTLGGNVTFNVGGSGRARISGNLDLGGGTRTFSIADGTGADYDLLVDAAISSSSGTFGLIKATAGSTLVLAGSNTYTGVTTVNAGVLNIRHATALGSTAVGTTVNSGTALQIQGDITVVAEPVSLSGTGIGNNGALRNISGTNACQGTVTLSAASRINSDAGTLTFSAANAITSANLGLTLGGAGDGTVGGTITIGSGTLTKDGAGTWTLTGANTYTGITTVDGGTLVLGGTGGAIAATGATALTLNNGGTLELNNSIDNNINRLAGTTGVTLKGGTFRFRGGNGVASSESMGVADIKSGISTVDVVNGTGAGSSSFVTFSSMSRTWPSLLNFTYSGTGMLGGGATNEPRVIITAQGAGVIAYATVNGTNLAEYVAVTGIRAVASSAEFDGHASQSGSNTQYTANRGGAFDDLDASRAVHSLTIISPGSDKYITLGATGANDLTVTSGGILLSGTNSFEITRTGTSTGTIKGTNPVFTVCDPGAVLTINVPISGGNTVVKAGAGKLVLGGDSTYTGATAVQCGVLKAGVGTSAFGSNSALTLADAAGVELDITGFNTTIGSLAGGGATGGNVTLGAATMTFGGNGTSTSYAGVISGTGGLIKTGAGTLTLSGTNLYTGTTLVNGGMLKAGVVTSAFGSNSAVILADAAGAGIDITGFNTTIGSLSGGGATGGNVTLGAATLTLGGNDTSTSYAGVISGTGGLIKTGAGMSILSGSNTYAGATTISNGVLNIRHNTALGTTAAGTTVGSGAALQLEGGVIVGNEALSISGTGLGNAGALRNSGGANVWQGTVTLAAASRINTDAGTLTFNTAANSITGAFNLTLGGEGDGTIGGTITIGAGILTKDGGGMWTLRANNNYTGATVVSNGTLVLTGQLSGTSGVTVDSGATLAGTGTVTRAVTVSGTLAPGVPSADQTGSLSVGAYTNAAAGKLSIQIGGSAAGDFDQVVSSGSVRLAGTLEVTIVDGYGPLPGTTFTIINKTVAGSVTGTFDGLPEGQEFVNGRGHVFVITYAGGDGNDVVLTYRYQRGTAFIIR